MQSVELPSGKGAGDENFPVGSRLISPALRPHVHAFYDFARNADDIADSATLAPDDKLARLDRMDAVLTGAAADGSPSATALRASLEQTGVTPQHSLDLLQAFRQDAVKQRYASWDELLDYCRYSAAPVGRHVLDLHGEDQATYAPSDALCASLQVLNHLQDGGKDLRALDRCYLPQDVMDRYGASPDDLLAARMPPGMRGVTNDLLDRVKVLNQAAQALPGTVRDRRLRVETAVIVGLARRLTQRLGRQDPVATRVKLLKADVVGSILRALPALL